MKRKQISPLVGWALVQEPDSESAVVGLVAWQEVELCDQQDNFAGYVYLADMMSDGFVLDDEFEDGWRTSLRMTTTMKMAMPAPRRTTDPPMILRRVF